MKLFIAIALTVASTSTYASTLYKGKFAGICVTTSDVSPTTTENYNLSLKVTGSSITINGEKFKFNSKQTPNDLGVISRTHSDGFQKSQAAISEDMKTIGIVRSAKGGSEYTEYSLGDSEINVRSQVELNGENITVVCNLKEVK